MGKEQGERVECGGGRAGGRVRKKEIGWGRGRKWGRGRVGGKVRKGEERDRVGKGHKV